MLEIFTVIFSIIEGFIWREVFARTRTSIARDSSDSTREQGERREKTREARTVRPFRVASVSRCVK